MSPSEVTAEFTMREESLHTLTHGVGVVLSIGCSVAMLFRAAALEGVAPLLAVTVFGLSLFVLYLASTLYHAATAPRAKRAFQIFDHVAIYYLIAGTYTPFALVALGGTLGWTMFAVVWTMAAAGTIFELVTQGSRQKLSLLFYLATGWVVIFFIGPMIEQLSSAGLWWLAAGGIFYTAGTVFYAWKRIPYNHAIWHLFVLAGSAAHVWGVFGEVLVG